MTIGREAIIPNPALKPFAVLVGTWRTTGTHPMFPDTTFHGRTSFEWIEGGAFLMMRSEIDEPAIPSGIAIYGSDNVAGTYFISYFDERGVSRKYDVSIAGNQLTSWRDEPHFSQRMTITIEDGGNWMTSKGEMSRDGAAWEEDLALTFERMT